MANVWQYYQVRMRHCVSGLPTEFGIITQAVSYLFGNQLLADGRAVGLTHH